MGEYAELMLNGTFCEGCGEYLGRGASGFPQYCSAKCAKDRGFESVTQRRGRPIRCECGGRFVAVEHQHQRAAAKGCAPVKGSS